MTSTQGASPKSLRYFYTDPLAAAWNREKYGMRFTDSFGTELKWCHEFSCFHLPDGAELSQKWDGNHYIHPDSLHLLETQKGDLVFSDQMDAHFRVDDHFPLAPREKIIQRNGMAFHWPEQEAA